MINIIINDVADHLPESSKPLPTHGNAWLNLLACLGYPVDDLPLGDFLARYHQLDGRWLAMTPVQWEASHNNANITAIGSELGMSEEQSHSLFADVSAFLIERQIKLHYHDAQIWLMNIDDKLAIHSQNVWAMRHQPMMNALKNMDMYWSSLMTELQMFLSAHPAPLNGVWFYGSARFDAARLSHKRILTDDWQLIANFSAQPFAEPIKKPSLIFLNDKSRLSACKHKANWFWNNAAYATRAPAWWKLF